MRRGWQPATSGCGGWVMIEVAVSLVLLAVILGALCRAWIASVQHVAHAEEILSSNARPSTEGPQGWDWGLGTVDVHWLDGPSLLLTPCSLGSEAVLGVWVDGWLLLEQEVPWGADSVAVGGWELWQSHAGEEVVLRLREPESGWGPPWHVVVPGGGDPPACTGSVRLTVHLRLLGRGEVVARTSGGEIRIPGSDVVDFEAPAGLVCVAVGTAEQALIGVPGEAVDLYF